MASQQSGGGMGGGMGGSMGGGPMSMMLQGMQEVTVRLPDIQAMVNQNITGIIYSTVSEYFNQLASSVRTASNFEDVANAMSNGMSQTKTKQVGGQ